MVIDKYNLLSKQFSKKLLIYSMIINQKYTEVIVFNKIIIYNWFRFKLKNCHKLQLDFNWI